MLNLSLRRLGYLHRFTSASKYLDIARNPTKVVCVAKNYSHLLSERTTPLENRMNNASIFMKPPSSMVSIYDVVSVGNRSDVVCETELALLVTKTLRIGASSDEIIESRGGVAIAFYLTKKDMQNALKS